MKKLFVSILALAAFAACQSDFNNDVNLDAPQGGSVVNQGAHTIYAEVGVGEADTKATYGDGLKATWEESDQIALLQEHANYGSTFSVVNKLNIKEGWGTSKALFNGDISVDATSPRVYHIAYPASAVSFSTSMSQEVVVTNYNKDVDGWTGLGYKGQATGYAKCTYNSTLNIVVPTTQSGKWEPYMYASTSEAVNSEAIGAKTLTTLNGAIAIRAFKADGVTPKQLSSITITSSDTAIAGTFSGTAQSVGNTTTVTGAKTNGNDLYDEGKRESEAIANLTSDLTAYEATSTSVTKTLSLSFAGNGKSITATNLEAIAAEENGYYTYYVNVAPATLAAETLTIVAVDADGSSLTRVVNKAVEVKASHRVGFNLTWESATLKGATIETWYNDWNKGSQFQLAGNTLYVDNISVEGNIAADHVKAIGVRINGEFHEASAQSGVKAISPIVIESLSSGVYTVQPVAQVELNGELKWLEGGVVEKTVTSIPQVIDYSVRTSYSSNGGVAKTNDINGDILKVKANISDSYVANNLVNGKTYTICYGNNTATQTLGSEKTLTLAHTAWGQYVCYVKISLPNGYVIESDKYTTHVTGIPYTYDFDAVRSDNNNWLGWTPQGASKASTSGGYKVTKLNSKYMVSPKHHTPASIAITATASCYAYLAKAKFAMSATSATNTKSTSGTEQEVSSKVYTNSMIANNTTSKSWDITISSSTPYIYIGANKDNAYVLKVSVAYK